MKPTMKHHIIGLTGFAGTGKDTVADLLVTHEGFRKLAFADALRAEVAEGFGVDLVYLSQPSTKDTPLAAMAMRRAPIEFIAALTLAFHNIPRHDDGHLADAWLDEPRTPRQIMQWWGTEFRRRQSPRYWTTVLQQRVNFYLRDGNSRLVITDCRFENEVDTLRAMGGQIWQVTRPGIHAASTQEGKHASATDGAAFKPDAVIANTHDIRHLQQLVLSEFTALATGIKGATVVVPV